MKTKLGPTIFWIFSAIPILLWLIVRSGTPMFSNYSVITHSLGQLSGLVGMTMFALTFILTMRLKIVEEYFNGLDKVYQFHHLLGILSFVLILFHPLLLVIKFIPSNIQQAALYLLPSSSWPINFGIIALLAMILLIVLTIFAKITYKKWRISHKFMGLVFLIACFHVFLVTTDITFYPLLKYYMILISVMGALSYLYGSFVRHELKSPFKYKLESIKSLSNNILLLKFSPLGKKINFKPGQFIFIKFLDSRVENESHPFTIASGPDNEKLTFAIKSLGDFTNQLKSLSSGAIVEIEGPYGKFGQNAKPTQEQVWIAGGIGITPFLSIAQSIKFNSKVDLYYCTRNKEDAIFLPILNEIANKSNNNLKIIPYHTEEKPRLSAEIIEKISGLANKSFLLCGPTNMMLSLESQLKKKGVKSEDIHFEDFNLK
ncbi:MAG: ferric reductase-like transmembrane domain-containing protein [Nanoarchaeota archaeon]